MSLRGLYPTSFHWKERWRVETDYVGRLKPSEKQFLAAFNVEHMRGVSEKDAISGGNRPLTCEPTADGAEARAELAWALRDRKNLHKAIRLLRSEK